MWGVVLCYFLPQVGVPGHQLAVQGHGALEEGRALRRGVSNARRTVRGQGRRLCKRSRGWPEPCWVPSGLEPQRCLHQRQSLL